MTLPHDLGALATARRFVDDCCTVESLRPIARLLASELVSNAYRYANGPIGLDVVESLVRLRVEVTDTNPEPPRLIAPTLERPDDLGGGRGLLLVDRLSERWGHHPNHPLPGKVVWFELRTDREPGRDGPGGPSALGDGT
jgi:hypothetical protein